MPSTDLTFVQQTVEQLGTTPQKVLEILQALQDHYGYLPPDALEHLSAITDITPASITGVSSFYDRFRHHPAGKHTINICIGTACHVKGADSIYDAFKRHLAIPDNDDTDPDKLFTLEKVACLGCCTLAPAVQIDQTTYGHLTADTVPQVINDFLMQEQLQAARPPKGHKLHDDKIDPHGEIRIGLGSCCVARGSGKLHQAIQDTLYETGITAIVKPVGCVGMCYQTPLLEIVLPDKTSFLYTHVEPRDAKSIILKHFKVKSITATITNRLSDMLDNILTDNIGKAITRYPVDTRDPQITDFLDAQKHIATENFGTIDPVDLDEYLAHQGFTALKTCLKELTTNQLIANIQQSGLRGRGGAGFPTHLKWSAVAQSDSPTKYIICNGDEGDPGAFMDRMLMESYPYRVIEGMIIAAYAVGANQGHFYIRSEYPLATTRLAQAMENCRNAGLLGNNIAGTDFSLHIQITPGAGAFVCGEETALLASIQGSRGTPRLRPPYPSQAGLWQKPTLINNVETLASVPWIIRNTPQSFAQLGSNTSKGTKVFSLAGKVTNGGLIEVPMGITIRQIIEDIGGGIASGLPFKAVQIGGPSGGCLPNALADIPVDYESLINAGAIMGSGGLVVLDDSDCMVDIARYFLQFTQNQSCGKCTFCRIGTRRMLDILDRICNGQGKNGDIEELENLAHMVRQSSLCGLGKTAPNPVLSTIKHFRDEYLAHLGGSCPAGKCKALITYSITDDCIGCTLCAQHCPADAIEPIPYQKHQIDSEKCIRCNTCKDICPADAIEIV